MSDKDKNAGVNDKGKNTVVYFVKQKFVCRHKAGEIRSVSNWTGVRAAASHKPQAAVGGGTEEPIRP